MKKVLVGILSLAMIASLAACGGSSTTTTTTAAAGDATEAATEAASEGGETEAEETTEADKGSQEEGQESAVVEKVTMTDTATQTLLPFGTRASVPGMYEVYEMLYEADAFTGEMEAVLADDTKGEFGGYDHEEGTGVYTVYLKEGIHDQAGNDVTASDVAFSYNYSIENAENSGWTSIQSVEADGDYTVVFTFDEEQTALGALLNVFARCAIVTEKAMNDSASGLATEMCGTGPYKFVSYSTGAELTIEADDNYWNKGTDRQESQQNVKTIVYEFIDEGSQKVNGLNTGKLDIAQDMKLDDVADYEEGGQYADQFSVESILNKFVYYLAPNCGEESLCNDINLRMAIMYAIDRQGLVTALGGDSSPLPSYAVSYYPDYNMVDWASMDNYNTQDTVDTAKVKEYLDKSNYNGETLKLVTQGDSMPATVIAAQLAAQGITVEVSVLDNSSLQTTMLDPSAWDLTFGMMAGDYNVTVWEHMFSYGNTGDGDHTSTFIYDDEWEEMLETCLSEEGHTSENMEAWWQHLVDNAYAIGCYAANKYTVIPTNMTQLYYGDKLTILPGACTYAE